MKSKKMLCTLALTTVIFQGVLAGNAKAAVTAENRIYGSNRYETSSAISQKGWVTSDTVILASGEKFADALCSGPLAKKYNAPVLLTSSESVSDTTLNELSRLQAKNIIIIGGTGAISTEVENQLKSKGYSIERIGGKDRYETSAMIAAKLDKPSSVVIASGEGFPDALSISTIAAKLGMPILLSSKAGLSDYAKDYITENGITKTYIVGGTGVLPDTIENQVPSPTRLAGQNRYGTNLAVIKEFESNLSYDNVYLSSSQGYADALSGAVLASNSNSPLILTNVSIDTNLNDYIKGKITSNSKVIALGGTAVVPDSLVETVSASQPTTENTGESSTDGTGDSSSEDTTQNIQDLSDGGQHTGDYTILTGGTFGDSVKTTSISGTISVKDSDAAASDELVLQNLDIIGTLTVDFGAGNVILNNVKVNGIEVLNVGANSLHIKGNSVIENLTVDDPNNDAHIVVEDKATIAAATVLSGANLEVASTEAAFSNITLEPKVAPTNSNQVMLTGTFDTVNVAKAAKVVLAPETKIETKLIATAPLEFIAPETAKVAKVDIKPNHSTDTFVLSGNLDNVNVSAVSNVQVKSGKVKVSSDTKAAVNVTVAQNAIVNTLADSGIVLAGEGQKVTREKSTEAKVVYLRLGNGKINEFTINDLPAAVTVQKFLDNLLVSAFANVQVVDASGNQVNGDIVLDNTMKLKVTAEDGTTTNTYALKVAALPAFEANYPTAASGEASSRTILVTTKANQPGHIFMVALPSGAAAPTSAQVKAGIDASGKFVANANYDLSLGEEKVGKIAVNADNTPYDIYVVLLSANGTLQLKPVKLTATSPISLSKGKDIVEYRIDGQSYPVKLDKEGHTITLQVPYGTDLSKLVPVVTVSPDAKIDSPVIDFSKTIKYTVTAQDGSTQGWTVNCVIDSASVNITLLELKNEIEHAINMINIPVGNNPGDYSDQSAMDGLNKAIYAAKTLVERGITTEENIKNAFSTLLQAEKLLSDSIITGLMTPEYKPVTASSSFNQIIKVNIVGAGDFIENLNSSNIILGGDFEGLTVKSVVMDKEHPWEAGIELIGNLTPIYSYGTITVDAAGWNGMGTSHDITTKVKVVDPNALNVTWPMNNDNTFTTNHSGINIGFDSGVQVPTDWSKIIVKDSNGISLRITSVHNAFYNNELEIEFDSKGNGQYKIFIPENTLTDVSGIKHNKAINFAFNIQLPNSDIEMLKNEISNLQNMTNIPVGDKVGNCSDQSAKDALIKALADAQAVVEKVSPTQEELNNAFNALQQAQKLMSTSIITGLMPSDYRPVIASTDFNQIIKVNVAGSGCFINGLNPSNITLGGDFTELTVKSAVIDSAYPWNASIELAGSLTSVSGYGTITVNAEGWNATGTPHDITAKVAVVDPNVLNVTWPVNNDFNNYDAFIFNHRGISIGFDSDVQLPTDLSKIIVKDSNGSQVPVTGVHYINLDSKRELQIECGFITDGQYNVFIPENTLTDVSGSKPNKAINFAFKIQLPNADIDMLKNEILFAQNAVNVPVGDSVGFCPQQSIIDALKSALSDAQALVQNSNAAQEDIKRVFYALQQAEQVVGASMITGMASPINNVAANANFNQTIEVNIVGGKFIPNLDPSYITLGGDFKGLTVQSVLLDTNEPWRANISLIGNLQLNTGSGTITVKGSGWNGPNENKDVTTTINVNSGEIVPQTTN